MGWFSSSKAASPINTSCEKIRLKYLGDNNNADIQTAFNHGCGLVASWRCAFLKDLTAKGNIDDPKTCLFYEDNGLTRQEATQKARDMLRYNTKCPYYAQKFELDDADLAYINSRN